MTQTDLLPLRLQGWYPIKRSFFSGDRHHEYNVVISLREGMPFALLREEMEDIELEFSKDYDIFKFKNVTRYDLNGEEINEVTAFGFREETDNEYKARLDAKQLSEFEQEQRERAELARLTLKYANNKD